MRIDRLRIERFRRHRELDLEPAAGLTVIRGPNESGKSTIQQALEAALFVKAESEAQAVRALWCWGESDPPSVTLEFEADGSRGRLTKTFGGGKGSAELVIGDEVIRDPTAIQERIHTLTGIPNEAFFRSTASVGHAELTHVGADEPLIQDRLQKAISGADRGTAEAKKKLAAAIQRYRSEGRVNPGRLKIVREEIEHLANEVAQGERQLEQLEVDRAAWVEAHERRRALEEQLAEEEAAHSEAQRAEALTIRRDEMQARYERAKRGAELIARETELRRSAPTRIPLPELRDGVGRLNRLELDRSELDARLAVDADAEAMGAAPRPWPWVALAVVAVVGAALGWFLLQGLAGLAVLLVLAVVTIVFLVQSVRVAFAARRHELAREMAARAAVERQQEERQLQDAYRRVRHDYEQQLAELGVPDVAAADTMLAAAEAHSQELAGVEGELRGLGIEDRDLRRVEDERDRSADAAERARHALSAMGEVAEDAATKRKELAERVARTSAARDAARSEEDRAHGRVEANAVDAESVAILAERLAAARARQTELEARLLVYQGTLAAIEAAEQATLKTAARYLEERMGPVIARVTDGRYRDIEVDEADLAFRVRAPETGEMVSAEVLSRGTADQLYLAARLGLVRLVTMDRRPPLILDDPFVTFDAPRARRSITILREVAAEQGVQVLFLTWSDRYDLEADTVIELPAPAAIPAPASSVPAPEAGRSTPAGPVEGSTEPSGVAEPQPAAQAASPAEGAPPSTTGASPAEEAPPGSLWGPPPGEPGTAPD